ncbi:PilZ domain-containing protein [bacterium]|nr:PilZ domain-containing protein [bacterium]
MAGQLWAPRLELTPWQDRRRRVRADCRLEVTTDLGTCRMTGYVMDLSWTGFRLETSRPVPSGSLVQMSPPNDQPGLRCWCTCRWSRNLPARRGAAPAFLSGHEFMPGPMSPSEGWVRQSLARLGMEEACLADRRRTPRFATHLPAKILGRDELWGEITNISLHGANLLLPCPVFDKPLQLLVPVADQEIRLQCSRRATRLVSGAGFSNHLSWEHLPAQIRAVALWLRTANVASLDKP